MMIFGVFIFRFYSIYSILFLVVFRVEEKRQDVSNRGHPHHQ